MTMMKAILQQHASWRKWCTTVTMVGMLLALEPRLNSYTSARRTLTVQAFTLNTIPPRQLLQQRFRPQSPKSQLNQRQIHEGARKLAFSKRRNPITTTTTRLSMEKEDGASNANADRLATLDDNAFDSFLAENKLGEAVQYLKDHPETELTRERWNDIFRVIETVTAMADADMLDAVGSENQRATTASALTTLGPEFPAQSDARRDMTHMYQQLQQMEQLQLFGVVQADRPLAAGSHVVAPALLESILGLPMQALTPQPTPTLFLAGLFFALAEGFISVLTGISLNALVLATIALAFVDRIALNGGISDSFIKLFRPGMQGKILRHEAGHFLAAYLLGCPVEGVVTSPWAALQDARFGRRGVAAGTSFFDPDLADQMNGRRSVSRSALDRYSMIVMAGIAAEADVYGRADGGAGDEMALIAFLSQLRMTQVLNEGRNRMTGGTALSGEASSSSSGAVVWTPDVIRNQARWGALQSVLMLRKYKPAYDALVDALERGGTLGDCIYAIEKAARDANLAPSSSTTKETRVAQPMGYIVDEPGAFGPSSWRNSTEFLLEASVVGQQAALQRQQQELKDLDQAAVAATTTTEFNEADSLAKLREYRSVVEERLRELEHRLEKVQE